MGLETEYCIRYSPPGDDRSRFTKKRVCLTILSALGDFVTTAPGDREGEPNFQRFTTNGGAFSFEVWPNRADDGLLESATPECRGPSQVLLYQRAQEALIQKALPKARARLGLRDGDSDLAIVKNCRDADGHSFGAQENYEAEVATGWRLFAYRVGAAGLLPILAITFLALIAFFVLGFIVGGLLYLSFRLLRHLVWAGNHPESFESPSDDGPYLADEHSDFDLPPWVLRFVIYVGLVGAAPVMLAFLALLRLTAFRNIRAGATAFFVSRPIITGAGTLDAEGAFGLSERAASAAGVMRMSLRRKPKYFFDPANLVKQLFINNGSVRQCVRGMFARRQRLQLGLSDSNCAQTAEFLKFGITSMVLDMAEAGYLKGAPRVRRPARALKKISSDPTLRARVAVKNRDAMTALELQRWYLHRAEEFVLAERIASIESREVLTLWRATLQALERNRASLIGRLDWVTKEALLAGSETLTLAARKKIDIKYHELGSGYFARLEARGLAPVRVRPNHVYRAMSHPPQNTPALERGHTIRDAGHQRSRLRICW
jgi:proteasome accessory factor A